MVVYYQVFGQKVGSHWLSIATLSTTFIGAWALSGGSKTATPKSPPTMSKSSDEEKFIQEFLNEQGGGKEAAKHREGH